MELKKFSIKAQKQGMIEGWANVYEINGEPFIDRHGDTIRRGALPEPTRVPVLISHDSQKTVGTALLEEMEHNGKYGIWAKIQLAIDADSPTLADRAKEAFDLVKHGIMTKMSIGFLALKFSYRTIKGQTVRVIKKIDMIEVSLTTTPCNSESNVVAAKGMQVAQPEKHGTFVDMPVTPHVNSRQIAAEVSRLIMGHYPKANPYIDSLLDIIEEKTGVRDWQYKLIEYDPECGQLYRKAIEVSGMNPFVAELLISVDEAERIKRDTGVDIPFWALAN